MEKKMKKVSGKVYHYGFQLVAVGMLTGLFAGLVVTLYNALTKNAESFSRGVYAYIRENPAFVPLLFVALFLGAIVVGGVVKFIPMIRGSGIPQTEGATRGQIHFTWYKVLTGMFAASLFTVFMGLSAGSEGPSIMIGGASGYGTSDMLKRNETIRRYQVTGGACTGLAVAFNAPLTGMAFAFEEAHKRFTPEVFVCSFSSVVVGVLTRNLLGPLVGLSTGSSLTTYVFPDSVNLLSYLYILLGAVVCGLAGVGFYFLVFKAKKLFSKVTFWKGMGKMTIPFVLGGAFGLITVYAMGGGHELLEHLGGGMSNMESVFGSPLWATLLIVFVIKFIASVLSMGVGVPCGVFIPMLAVGACLGGLMSLLCGLMGMDPAYSDIMVMICMAAFFTTVVKAPITAIVMVVELTWNFTLLTPVILGVAIGYLLGDVFRTEPIYDKLLEGILAEQKSKEQLIRVSLRFRIHPEALATGRAIRDILWPQDTLVVAIFRGDESLTPDGETVINEDDVVLLRADTTPEKREALIESLSGTMGEYLPEEEPEEPAAPEEENPEETAAPEQEEAVAPEDKPVVSDEEKPEE